MRLWFAVGMAGLVACSAIAEENGPAIEEPEADASTGESSSSGSGTSSSSGGRSGSSSSSSSSGQSTSSSGGTDAGPDGGGGGRTFVSIAAGVQNTCAVLQSGRLACWGGADGTGPVVDADSDLPQLVLDAPAGAPLEHVAAVGVGNGTTCAILAQPSRVLCWGNDGYGRTGGGNDDGSDAPIVVVDQALSPVDDWQPGPGAVAMGPEQGCALRTGGRVACWGRTAYGMLGRDDSESMRPYAADVVGLDGNGALDGVTQLALGQEFSCALRNDGKVYCWGNRFRGALGDNTNSGERFTPAPVQTEAGALTGVTQITAGGGHACALAGGGQIYCWGKNGHKELGVFVAGAPPSPESKIARPVLVSATGAPLASMRSVAAGTNHTCAVDGNGAALCWGFNNSSQLGNGNPDSGDVLEPAPVRRSVDLLESLVGIRAVAAGAYHSVALDESGGGFAWGDRALGRDEGHSDVALPILMDELPITP